MQLPATRTLFLWAFLGCLGLIAIALYLEHIVGLEPCPLCHVQRFAVALFGLLCLLATVHNPKRLGQDLCSTDSACRWTGASRGRTTNLVTRLT